MITQVCVFFRVKIVIFQLNMYTFSAHISVCVCVCVCVFVTHFNETKVTSVGNYLHQPLF